MTKPDLPAIERHLYLTTFSPRDANWSTKKAQGVAIANLYRQAEYTGLETRTRGCAPFLGFALEPNKETGEVNLKLRDTRFCRVRFCPVCQWRRQMMWMARLAKALPKIITEYPKHRFILLTLTVRNCPLTELRSTLDEMSKAWKRLTDRKQFIADGWLKNVEVTRSADDYAHPHIHAVLMVPTTYFKGDHYLSQKKWTALWRESMRLDYDPIVHVQVIKSNYAHTPQSSEQTDLSYAHKTDALLEGENGYAHTVKHHLNDKGLQVNPDLMKSIRYTLKYQVKPDSLLDNAHTLESNSEWLAELTRQTHKTRAIALGGIFKEYLSEDDPEDLINGDEEPEVEVEETDERIWAAWYSHENQYMIPRDQEREIRVLGNLQAKADAHNSEKLKHSFKARKKTRTVLTE